jgi:glycosyltransferase 2 family protein
MREKRRTWPVWVAGAALIAIILYHLSRSPDWRGFDWGRLGSLLVHVRAGLVILAVIVTCSSYVVRAYRWKLFVTPVKKCSFRVLLAGQFLGFSSLYLIGRAGELVRPAYIANRERLPFVSQMAVWVVERVYDSIALAILLALALYFEPLAATGRTILAVHSMHVAAAVVLIIAAAVTLVLAFFRARSPQLIRWLTFRLRPGRGKILKWLLGLLGSFSAGLAVVNNLRDFSASIAATALLWTLNVTMIWLDLKSLGGHVAALSWWATALIQFLACAGLVVQIPGIGGGVQVAVLLALKDLFRISGELAAGAAILFYVTLTLPCIAVALAFLIHDGLTFKKLRLMADTGSKTGVGLPVVDANVVQSSSSGADG